jgi:hypothetical protein
VNDQEHPADPGHGPGSGGRPPPPGDTPTAPARPVRAYRADSLRGVIFGRGAGWAVSAVLAGAVVALSILLAEGSNGPVAVRVFNAPAARQFVGPQAAQVPPGILTRPGMQVLGPGFQRVAPLLPAACLRAARTPSGQTSASPGSGATATPLPSASPGQSRVKITLPGGHGVTCIVTVRPG